MTEQTDNVAEVRLMRKKNQPDEYYVNVRVRSRVRKNLLSQHNIPLDSVGTKTEMAKAVEIGAGALAEHQCENFGDTHDPEEVAKMCRSLYEELWRRVELQS